MAQYLKHFWISRRNNQLTSNRKFLNHSWFLLSPFVLPNYYLAVFINKIYSFLPSIPYFVLSQGSTHLRETFNLLKLKLWYVSVSWVLGSQAHTESSSCSAGEQTRASHMRLRHLEQCALPVPRSRSTAPLTSALKYYLSSVYNPSLVSSLFFHILSLKFSFGWNMITFLSIKKTPKMKKKKKDTKDGQGETWKWTERATALIDSQWPQVTTRTTRVNS